MMPPMIHPYRLVGDKKFTIHVQGGDAPSLEREPAHIICSHLRLVHTRLTSYGTGVDAGG